MCRSKTHYCAYTSLVLTPGLPLCLFLDAFTGKYIFLLLHLCKYILVQSKDWEQKGNMSSSPTGCCAVQWAMWKGGGLTSRDRLYSSENYLLLGFLLVRPVQTFLLLVRQPITQDNCSISVSYRSSSNVTCLKNLLTLENKMKLFRRVELGQETIKSRNEVLPFFCELWSSMETTQQM